MEMDYNWPIFSSSCVFETEKMSKVCSSLKKSLEHFLLVLSFVNKDNFVLENYWRFFVKYLSIF